MALDDAINETLDKAFTITVCAFAKLFVRLSKEDQETLIAAMEKGIATRTLVESLAREGYKIGNETLNSHRYGRCRCPKA